MLALCSMLLVTYYAQNYAGIISWSLVRVCIGGGRYSNQVGLIDRRENISIVKIKSCGALLKSGGAAAS